MLGLFNVRIGLQFMMFMITEAGMYKQLSELQKFFIFSAAHSLVRLDIETKFPYF